MDKRCPLKKEKYPAKWCPLAVQRLKALRLAGRELTEEEESKLPGCAYAVASQMHNYCFFSYMKDTKSDRQPLDIEIAHLLNIGPDSVKKIEKAALSKIRDTEFVQELQEAYGDEAIMVDDTSIDPYEGA